MHHPTFPAPNSAFVSQNLPVTTGTALSVPPYSGAGQGGGQPSPTFSLIGQPISTSLGLSPVLSLIGGRVLTNSLVVAEHFGKRHKDVLRAVKRIDCSVEFGRRNFAPSSYLNEQGKKQPLVEMTRDGFTFLVMGFTGNQAARWKEAYIEAFNVLEARFAAMDGKHFPRLLDRLRRYVKVRILDDLAPANLTRGTRRALYFAYLAWLTGEDLRTLVPKSTYYRYRRQLLPLGIDLNRPCEFLGLDAAIGLLEQGGACHG